MLLYWKLLTFILLRFALGFPNFFFCARYVMLSFFSNFFVRKAIIFITSITKQCVKY